MSKPPRTTRYALIGRDGDGLCGMLDGRSEVDLELNGYGDVVDFLKERLDLKDAPARESVSAKGV